MSSPPVAIECEGAPRDLGLDQGRACTAALRATVGRGPLHRLRLRLARSAPLDRATRDLRRHFPHQAEVLDGMAGGAGVPRESLGREVMKGLRAEALAGVAVAVGSGEGAWLARSAPPGGLLRRSRPEGQLASLDLTLPWLPAALAGVNEAGLAVAAVVSPGAGPGTRCAAPGALLLQDCLQRFDALEPALEWVRSRPGGGRCTLLLADARGEVGGIFVDGDHRRLRRPGSALLVAGSEPADEVEKRLRESPPRSPQELGAGLGTPFAALDPAGRRIALGASPSGEPHWVELRAR